MNFDWIYLERCAMEGRQQRLATCRELVKHVAPSIFYSLDQEIEDPYLEPTLVSAARMGVRNVAQVLAGYISIQRRRGSSAGGDLVLSSRTTSSGDIILPPLQPIRTEFALTTVDVRVAYDGSLQYCGPNSKYRDAATVPALCVLGGAFSVLEHCHPLYKNHLIGDGGARIEISVTQPTKQMMTELERALFLVRLNFPEFFKLVKIVTRNFVLFESGNINSFASSNFHGTAFFSLPSVRSTVYFLEEILHQCGHIVMDTIFSKWGELINEEKETPISKYTKQKNDSRPLFVVLHAAFTESVIAEGLLRALEAGSFAGVEKLEAIGRLTFVLRKFRVDLQNIFAIPSLVHKGVNLREQLLTSIQAVWARAVPFITSVDISGQHYNFDLEVFLTKNGHF